MRPNLTQVSDVKIWWDVVHGTVPPATTDLAFLQEALALLPATPWDTGTWGLWIDSLKAKTGRKGKELFMPLRLALTGHDHGPEMKLLLPLIGSEKVRGRLA